MKINWPLTHGLRVPAWNFTGREEQLQELIDNFKTTNLVLITGFGGIGKTEFCRKFAYDISNSNVSRVWLHGENLETLRDSVLKLANELGITNEGNPTISEYFEYIVSFILENSNRLLLVIDNVDVSYEEVVNVIKIVKMAKNEKRMFVIVTSRDRNVLEGAGITMKLDVLSKLQARQMLQKSMRDLSDSDADKLGKLVEYFPLALQQALGYVKQQRKHFRTRNYSVLDLVNEFMVERIQMLGHKLNQFEHYYSMTTLVTFDMTIRKFNDESVVEILKIIAYLGGVELNFLEKICKQMGVKDFNRGLYMLYNYCIIEVGELISVHKLLQEIVRSRLEDPEKYSKDLFDSVLLASRKFEKLIEKGPTPSEKAHLNNICKFAWNSELGEINKFNDALFLLLEQDRKLLNCAIEYIKLHFPKLQFRSDLHEKNKEFVRKVFFFSTVNNDESVNLKMIQSGKYNRNCMAMHIRPVETDAIKMFIKCIEIGVEYFCKDIFQIADVQRLSLKKLECQGQSEIGMQLLPEFEGQLAYINQHQLAYQNQNSQ